MTGHLVRLALIGLAIVTVPLVILAFGYSGTAAVLGAILAAALTWAPTLIILETVGRVRREGYDHE